MSASARTRAAVAAHASSLAAVAAVAAAAGRPVDLGRHARLRRPARSSSPRAAPRRPVRAPRTRARRCASTCPSRSTWRLIIAALRLTAGSPYTVQLVPFLLFVNMLLAFNWLVFTVIAMHRAATGQLFTYPLTLPPGRARPRHSPGKHVPDAQDRVHRRRLDGVHPQPHRRHRALPGAGGLDDVRAHGHRPRAAARPRSSSRGGSSSAPAPARAWRRRSTAGEALDGRRLRRDVVPGRAGCARRRVVDFEVPKRYGLRQTIADTLGVGGIMRGLRTIPVLLDVCRDMEELCPDALLLQYVNPMAMLCWAVAEASPIRTVGLCHSVQHTAGELAGDLGVPAEELDYHVAGINHVAFFLRLERDGRGPLPGAAAGASRRAACRTATASATSCCATSATS